MRKNKRTVGEHELLCESHHTEIDTRRSVHALCILTDHYARKIEALENVSNKRKRLARGVIAQTEAERRMCEAAV